MLKKSKKQTMSQEEKIEEAKQLIIEAMQLCQEVAEENNMNSNFEAYGKYGFDQLLGNGNPYDNSIFNLIK